MNVLVTGASGFIGLHLCKALLERKHNVVAIAYPQVTPQLETLSKDLRIVNVDIRHLGGQWIDNILENNKIESVFHLAALLPDDTQTPTSFFEVNTQGTLGMLVASHLNGVKRFVYASSMSVYSEPPEYSPLDEEHPTRPSTAYGISKLAGELYCDLYSSKMAVIILRYGGAFGKGERDSNAIPTFIKQALKGEPITIQGNGLQSSDFVHINDLISGTLLAWNRGKSAVYNIGSGRETSVLDLAKKIISITNSKSQIVSSGKTDRPFRFYLDIAQIKLLGYSPQPLDNGLRKYVEEFK